MHFVGLVFLCSNIYQKDGSPRCYMQFASLETGECYSFAAHSLVTDSRVDMPSVWDVCNVSGDIRQYGKSCSFVLRDFEVVGKLVLSK